MFPTKKSELIINIKKFSKNELSNYSAKRNFDYGPPHKNVSKLSPYLRRRFMSENEILKIVLQDHKISHLDKFIEEIFWRTYWRGWLEFHPWIYHQFEEKNRKKFIPKKTGIKCFDYWTDEIIQTGYLHNHSRMWYASIWIFTLGYSLEDGINFFKNNLIDWCPASNTLGWRWVAGLQTIGKPYLANSDNINKFTNNRFNPKGQLKENIDFDFSNVSNGKAIYFNYPVIKNLKYQENIGIVLNNNDLSLDVFLDNLNINYEVCLFKQRALNSEKNILITKFEDELYQNILKQSKNIELIETINSLIEWTRNKKIKTLILPYETTGNTIFNSKPIISKFMENKINFVFYLRDWDKNAFPFANKGFFNFKKNIPELLNKSGF